MFTTKCKKCIMAKLRGNLTYLNCSKHDKFHEVNVLDVNKILITHVAIIGQIHLVTI